MRMLMALHGQHPKMACASDALDRMADLLPPEHPVRLHLRDVSDDLRTGLSRGDIAKYAYEMADVMLAERARSAKSAAPSASPCTESIQRLGRWVPGYHDY